jgi:hypothetical protein
MWLNMCPLVKSRIEIKLIAAQRLRFWMTGRMYGAATVKKVIKPRIEVTTTAALM